MNNLLAPLAPLGGLFHVLFYEPVYNALILIYDFFFHLGAPEAFGIAIIVLTLLLRGALIPLTRKQLKSSREMQVVQPLLAELKVKYKNDPQKQMEEQRRIYKEHGVNPLAGCLPLFVQLPFLYALYGAFYTVLPGNNGDGTLPKINGDIYPFFPPLHAVPNLHFLWMQGISSLGTPDPLHILPILAGILTFVQLRMAMPVRKPTPGKTGDSTAQATKTMQYIMPFFTVFIGWRFPAGLALYWMISTGFSAVQQYFINGNWGSLFVGIPGMEHLVPAPQDVPSATVARAANLNRVSPANAAALTQQPASGGGFFGRLREQMRSMAEQQQAGAQGRANRDGTTDSTRPTRRGEVIVDADVVGEGEEETATFAPRPAAPTRKRPKAGGAMLVKPPSGTQNANSADEFGADNVGRAIRAGTDTSALPEQEIARDTAPSRNGSNGHSPTYGANGKKIAATSGTSEAKLNGANGKNGKASSNGTNGVHATNGTQSARRPTNAKYSNTSKRSSSNSGRARDTRSKGGR